MQWKFKNSNNSVLLNSSNLILKFIGNSGVRIPGIKGHYQTKFEIPIYQTQSQLCERMKHDFLDSSKDIKF